MCFRYLWSYPVNWASVNPDFARCPHSQSEKLAEGEFNICSHKVALETIRLPVLRLSRYSAITLSLWCTHLSFSLPPFSSGVLYSFLLRSTIQTTPWSLKCSTCRFHWPLLLPISVWGCHGYRATNCLSGVTDSNQLWPLGEHLNMESSTRAASVGANNIWQEKAEEVGQRWWRLWRCWPWAMLFRMETVMAIVGHKH